MNTEPDPTPVFLTGLDRSGKTAVRVHLGEHSPIWIGRKTEFWSLHHGRYGDLADDAALARCLTGLRARSATAELLAEHQALEDTFRVGQRGYGRLFGLLLGGHAARLGKARWGEQDAELESCAGRVFADYPAAVIIHLVRDPRSRYAALVRDAGRRLGGVGPATGAWLDSIRRGEVNAQRYPGRYVVLRAEDLGRSGSSTGDALHELLGVQGSALPVFAADPQAGWQSLSGSDVAYIEAHAGPGMARFDYSLSRPRLRPAQLVRHRIVDEPLGRVRLAARRARARFSATDRPR